MGDNSNNENTRRALEESAKEAEAQRLRYEAAEAEAIEASRRNEEARLAKEKSNVAAAIAASKAEAEAQAKALDEQEEALKKQTAEEYARNLMETVQLILENNPNQYHRDAAVLLMETIAIFDTSPYKSSNTAEQREAKNVLKQVQDRLSKMVTGDETEPLNENFILTLPKFLIETVYKKLGLDRTTVLQNNANYQNIKRIRDEMDAANHAKRREALALKKKIKNVLQREKNIAALEGALQARTNAKKKLELTRARFKNFQNNPKLKAQVDADEAAYEAAQKEYTRLREAFLKKNPGSAAAWAEGGKRTRKQRKGKKTKKTRGHK